MTHGLFEAVESWSLGSVERVQLEARPLLKEQGQYTRLQKSPPRKRSREGREPPAWQWIVILTDATE